MNSSNENSTPKVTVLMPVFNAELYIKESVESILNQTFSDFEFLIFDDCCTDNTRTIINSYNDPRIKLIINEKNLGLTTSLNIGLKIARGEYIARMDGDDISLPTRLEKQVEYMERFPQLGICGTWIETFGFEKKTVVNFTDNWNLLKVQSIFSSPLAHPSVLIRKKFLEAYHLEYDTHFVIAQDYDLWSKAVAHFDIGMISEVLLRYRTFDPASRSKYIHLQTDETKQIYRSVLYKIGITPTEEQLDTHNIIGFKKRIKTREDLDKCQLWLLYLKQKALESTIYKEEDLLLLLQTYWFSVCYSAAPLGFYSFKKYLSIKFSSNFSPPFSYRIKYFIKLIFKK